MKDDWWAWGPVSTSLEYNLADWAIAQMASDMARKDIAAEFYKRAANYKNLFDKQTMFMRPRMKDGTWLTPFDSLATEGSGDWEGSGGPGYVEGNAWNYTFFVPHDIPGLIELFGSGEIFAKKLLRSFSNGQFTINNEPDIAYPYLFTYVGGQEHLTPKLVNQIMTNDFGTGPDGLPGNDDCGAISAWFAFSALGFYPATPALAEYRIGKPLFDEIHITFPCVNQQTLTIRSADKKNPGNGSYGYFLNGEWQSSTVILHQDLLQQDVTLEFVY